MKSVRGLQGRSPAVTHNCRTIDGCINKGKYSHKKSRLTGAHGRSDAKMQAHNRRGEPRIRRYDRFSIWRSSCTLLGALLARWRSPRVHTNSAGLSSGAYPGKYSTWTRGRCRRNAVTSRRRWIEPRSQRSSMGPRRWRSKSARKARTSRPSTARGWNCR